MIRITITQEGDGPRLHEDTMIACGIFMDKMVQRLLAKQQDFSTPNGWKTTEVDILQKMLADNYAEGDCVDVANLVMFLDCRGSKCTG